MPLRARTGVGDPPEHVGSPAWRGGDLQAPAGLHSPRRKVAQTPPVGACTAPTAIRCAGFAVVLPPGPVVAHPTREVSPERTHDHPDAVRPRVVCSVGDALADRGHDVVGGFPVHTGAHGALHPHREFAGEATGCGAHRGEESPVQVGATGTCGVCVTGGCTAVEAPNG